MCASAGRGRLRRLAVPPELHAVSYEQNCHPRRGRPFSPLRMRGADHWRNCRWKRDLPCVRLLLRVHGFVRSYAFHQERLLLPFGPQPQPTRGFSKNCARSGGRSLHLFGRSRAASLRSWRQIPDLRLHWSSRSPDDSLKVKRSPGSQRQRAIVVPLFTETQVLSRLRNVDLNNCKVAASSSEKIIFMDAAIHASEYRNVTI